MAKFTIDKETTREVLRQIAGRMALKVQAEVKLRTPVVTGIARNSVAIEELPGIAYQIGTNLEYFEFLERGTKPHDIYPFFKKALKFEVNGKNVFAKKVKHPGTEALKIFESVANDEAFLKQALKESIREVIG